MTKGFEQSDPLLVISDYNNEDFTHYNTVGIKTYRSKFSFIIRSLTAKARIEKLLDKLLALHGDLQLYLTAFHPWNKHFLNWAKKQEKCTSLLTIHDYHTHSGESSTLIEKLQKQAIAQADQVITLSNYVKNQITQELGHSDKYIVVPHPTLDAGATNNLSYSPQPSLLFVGRVLQYKGLENLVAAVKDLNISKLTIAGKQTLPFKPKLKKIEVIDAYLTDDQIAKLLSEHHILVLPYLEASQSGIITLGLSAKIVMVVSKVGGLPEQLPENAAVWVEPSIASLRAGIASLMENQYLYDKVKSVLYKS